MSGVARFFPLYLIALLALGLGHLALLPPFEGFDENAHLSSVRELATTGMPPHYGRSRIDGFVESYRGPTPYDPPTFHNFFADAETIAAFLDAHRTPREGSTPYVPGRGENWQAQHPPLYYAVLAPLERATGTMSFVAQMLVLRGFSYLLAIGGLCFAFAAARLAAEDEAGADVSAIGFFAYPLVLPMFFPEFARLGNDSLCLLLAGLAAWLLAKWRLQRAASLWPILLGIVLGLGALTKALFLPLIAGIFVHLAWTLPRRYWAGLAIAAALCAIVGGGWYLRNFLIYGDAIGGHDSLTLAAQGGFARNVADGFPIVEVLRGIASVVVSWSWAGTWSLVRPELAIQVPLLLFTLGLALAWANELRRRPLADPEWIVVWMMAFFAVGLLQRIAIMVALSGKGGTPGWYLHILMPWAAPALGLALRAVWRHGFLRPWLIGGLLYAAAFHIVVTWSQAALFAGCATIGQRNRYAFPNGFFCLDRTGEVAERLAVLAWPGTAAIGFALGIAAAAALAVALIRARA